MTVRPYRTPSPMRASFSSLALVNALVCLGLNVQWGQTGLFNVGVAGFVAIGAYASALLTTPPSKGRLGGFALPILVGWLAAMAASGAVSAFRRRADVAGCGPTTWRSRPSASPWSSSSSLSTRRS